MTTVQAPPDVAEASEDNSKHHLPTFGFTRHGHAVHAKTTDHLPDNNGYARLNKKVALLITNNIGTMTCFWLFCVIALMALPAALVEAHIVAPVIGIIGEIGFVTMVSWLAQSFIQLVLLPALMVGQNLQNVAADARSAKTFEDVERIIDLLDCHTQGGLQTILAAVESLRASGVAPGGGAPAGTSSPGPSPLESGSPGAASGGTPA